MQGAATIRHGQYSNVEYRQFRAGWGFNLMRSIAGALTWPVVWPLAMLSRISDDIFRTFSELLSLLPYLLGAIIRGEFYRFALRHCGRNVVIEFGTVLIYQDITIGDNVLIGRYNTIHHCDIGNYVLVGEGCAFLSGSKSHNFARVDIPMALQGGLKKRISVGDDCWIGSHAVLMDDLGRGSVVGAGAVVTKRVPDFTVVAGNPARPVRQRLAAVKPSVQSQ